MGTLYNGGGRGYVPILPSNESIMNALPSVSDPGSVVRG